MAFQSTIRPFMASGIVGEIVYSGPVRARACIIESGASHVNNVVGRAFTYKDASINTDGVRVTVGGTGQFAGILTHSKQYTSLGTQTGGALAASMTLPNNTVAEFTYYATGVLVELVCTQSQAVQIGDNVYYNKTTGELAAGTTAPSDQYLQIKGARVIDQNVTGPATAPLNTLAIIELN